MGEPFGPRDRRLLDDTAAHAGAAVCAAVTELDLRAARERLVTSREEERRQLRRDLHDGVGPVLAGLGFTAEAAARALPADPARAAQRLRDRDPVRRGAQLPGIGLWLIAGLLMAIAVIRTRALPVVLGLGFAAGLPAAMALGKSGPLALAVLWGAVAAALAGHARGRRVVAG